MGMLHRSMLIVLAVPRRQVLFASGHAVTPESGRPA
jgi:hypothetical protein